MSRTGARRLPATVLVDREGVIRDWCLGELDGAQPAVLRTGEPLLAAAP